jgi:RNase P subunit RPR2
MMPVNKGLAMFLFGMLPEEALKANICVNCKEPAITFRDDVSKKEYKISAFCQTCQDEMFDSEGEE